MAAALWFGSAAPPPVFETVLAVLAVWRVAHLVARERGPFDLVSRLHAWAAAHAGLAALLACPYCLSLWFALAPAAWLAPGWATGVLLWLAISGGACVVERALPRE